jgi:hypothetical protein
MRRNLPLAFCLLGAFFIAGCASPDRPEHGGQGRPHVVQPVLRDSATFFDGAVTAEISLQPIVFHLPRGEEGGEGRSGGHRSRGFGRRGGGEGGYGGSRSFDNDSEGGPAPMHRPLGAPPRIELRGKFTNQTSAPIVIAVTDVTSALGNFAIRPEKLTLAAGESAEIDPLPALYPDPIDELTVDVRIRYAGKAENHSLRLTPAPTPAAQPMAPAPTP